MEVSAGASYVKLPEMQPTRPDNVIAETRLCLAPGGGEQRTCVRVVQSVVWHAVFPMRFDGVKSKNPKLTPANVTDAPDVEGPLRTSERVTAGASYVKLAEKLPRTFCTMRMPS